MGEPVPKSTSDSTRLLRERVEEALRAALLGGQLKPGVTYTVPSMALRFGVSATPVREALLDLAGEGLVTIRPNKGFRVVTPSIETVVHTANIRRLLEVPATLAAARSVSSIDLDSLRKAARTTERFAGKGDVASYLRADSDFHQAVLAHCGNPVLMELSERLRAQARMHAFPAVLAMGKLEASARDHSQLIEAMAQGDADAISAVVAHHIDHALTSVRMMEPLTDEVVTR
jgi:DNA-binding GntR family transcriptional regulator